MNLTRSIFELETMALAAEDPVRQEELNEAAAFCFEVQAALARQV